MADQPWTEAELRAAVEAYVQLMRAQEAGRPTRKADVYRELAARYGRTAKSFEYRMQNISHVLAVQGLSWLPGLRPARNVGRRVAEEIEGYLAEAQGRPVNESVGFEVEVQTVVHRKVIKQPAGTEEPAVRVSTTSEYVRDPRVRAWVLKQARGVCEQCKLPAPFQAEDGTPFLEVHHVRPLREGGSDTVENAVAICPNCHREFHFGQRRREMLEALYGRVGRLRRE